jgi:hypothetical protein
MAKTPRGISRTPKKFLGGLPMLALTLRYLGVSPRCLQKSSGMLFLRFIGCRSLSEGSNGILRVFGTILGRGSAKPAEIEHELRAGVLSSSFMEECEYFFDFAETIWGNLEQFRKDLGHNPEEIWANQPDFGNFQDSKARTRRFPDPAAHTPGRNLDKLPGNFCHFNTQNG